jgi:hypothetical protein
MPSKARPERAAKPPVARTKAAAVVSGACLCGGVEIEIDFPAFWAWHDHSEASRRAHGAAYATYAGCWKSKVRIARGTKLVSTFEDTERNHVRSFCSRCGTPLMFARGGSPKWLNVPRALFAGRIGREAKYHLAIGELQDWAWLGAPVGPLKGYPGVSIEKTRKASRAKEGLFEP